MSEFEFATAWRSDNPQHTADAKVFWADRAMVQPEEMEERAKTLCSLAYADSKLVGVSTVNFRPLEPLRSRFAFFRCAVAPEYRRQELAILLTRHTLTTMEGWSLTHPDEKLNGIAAVIEAPELGDKGRNPVWSEYYGNLNLVGFNPHGAQIRVAWFRHARLD